MTSESSAELAKYRTRTFCRGFICRSSLHGAKLPAAASMSNETQGTFLSSTIPCVHRHSTSLSSKVGPMNIFASLTAARRRPHTAGPCSGWLASSFIQRAPMVKWGVASSLTSIRPCSSAYSQTTGLDPLHPAFCSSPGQQGIPFVPVNHLEWPVWESDGLPASQFSADGFLSDHAPDSSPSACGMQPESARHPRCWHGP
jgi:hypothetical protein